jgi:hypothetical protein
VWAVKLSHIGNDNYLMLALKNDKNQVKNAKK